MHRAMLLVVLAGAGACGPASRAPSGSTESPTLATRPAEAATPEAATSKTRFCVEAGDSAESATQLDCQPTASDCEDYAEFLEADGWFIAPTNRCQSRSVVCASYQTAESPGELCARDLAECEGLRGQLLQWNEVVAGSVSPCS